MVDDVRQDPNLALPIRHGHHSADDQGQHDAADDRDADLEPEQLRDDVQCDQHEDEDQELSERAASIGGHRTIVVANRAVRPHLIGVTPMICPTFPASLTGLPWRPSEPVPRGRPLLDESGASLGGVAGCGAHDLRAVLDVVASAVSP